jgi:hypothetical protein
MFFLNFFFFQNNWLAGWVLTLFFFFFFKYLFIICKYTVAVFRLSRRGSQITLRMVVSHHVVAGIWTPDLRKSSRVLLPTEPSHQPPFFFFLKIYLLLHVSTLKLSSDTTEEGVRSYYRWLWATMWFLGFELWTFRRAVGCSYPLSHLTSPSYVLLMDVVPKASSATFSRVCKLSQVAPDQAIWLLFVGYMVMVHHSNTLQHVLPTTLCFVCLDFGVILYLSLSLCVCVCTHVSSYSWRFSIAQADLLLATTLPSASWFQVWSIICFLGMLAFDVWWLNWTDPECVWFQPDWWTAHYNCTNSLRVRVSSAGVLGKISITMYVISLCFDFPKL